MEDKTKVVSAQDVVILLTSLSCWSEIGFQNFTDSGVIYDLVEFLKKKKKSKKEEMEAEMFMFPKEELIGFSKDRGNVTMYQMIKLLNSMPLDDIVFWDSFATLFSHWSKMSLWWDRHIISWEKRDDFREEMGLERINPIVKNESPNYSIEVIYRRAGHCVVWDNPPKDYRYASLEEIKIAPLPRQEIGASPKKDVVTKVEGDWYICSETEQVFARDYIQGVFQNTTFFVALVKLVCEIQEE